MVDNIPKGKEIDYLIEEHIFGARRDERAGNITFEYDKDNTYINALEVPNYSTDIFDAWKVIEKMEQLGYWWEAFVDLNANKNKYAWCFSKKTYHVLSADTVPLVICKTALLAIEE